MEKSEMDKVPTQTPEELFWEVVEQIAPGCRSWPVLDKNDPDFFKKLGGLVGEFDKKHGEE